MNLRQLCNSYYPWFNRLLNANKINCLRVGAFQDLHNLNLLSLYDNKLQTIAKGTFAPLRAIQTLWVLPWCGEGIRSMGNLAAWGGVFFKSIFFFFFFFAFMVKKNKIMPGQSRITYSIVLIHSWKAFGSEPIYLWLPSEVAGGLSSYKPYWDQWCPLHQPPPTGKQKNRADQKQEIPLFR